MYESQAQAGGNVEREREPAGQDGGADDLWPRFSGFPAGRPRSGARERGLPERARPSGRPGAPGSRAPADRQAQPAAPGPRGHRDPDRSRRKLSTEEIVDAAIAVADAEGAEALSMRRIAQVLHVGTMSLYWHVANKEHLLDLMRDALMAEVEVPEPSGDWRADLRGLAVSMRSSLLHHTWLTEFAGGRPSLGPTTMLMIEKALTLLEPVQLEPAAEMDLMNALNTYVVGAVLRESQEIRAHQDEQAAAELSSPAQVTRDRQAWRDRIAATGRFPHFVRFLDSGTDPDAPETRDARFEFGLDCLLDGFAARVGGRERTMRAGGSSARRKA
jgi:AcrR family transcriptional regulator